MARRAAGIASAAEPGVGKSTMPTETARNSSVAASTTTFHAAPAAAERPSQNPLRRSKPSPCAPSGNIPEGAHASLPGSAPENSDEAAPHGGKPTGASPPTREAGSGAGGKTGALDPASSAPTASRKARFASAADW